jgi:predicted RecB family nuclease
MKRPLLSKSRLNAYHQCRKRLWLEVHRRDLLEVSEGTNRIFAVGHRVGALARAEHADGVLVAEDAPWAEAARQTHSALAARPMRPVFEAAASHRNVKVRADLLIPVRGGFHLAEVKSSTSVKEHHLPDAAVQTWVLRGAGIPVKSVELRHINREFVYPGNDDYRGLFTSGDIQDAVEKLQPDVPKWVEDAQAILGRAEPNVPMGRHCDAPYECPFKARCASLAGAGPQYPVTLLKGKNGQRLADELAREGFVDLRDVPASRISDDEKLHRIHAAVKSGQPFLDPGARKAIATWAYPRYHLDFETIDFAVPRWAGTRPYEQVPFQWSCHIDDGDGTLERASFLDFSGNDPSRACAEELLEALGSRGAVIAYNAGFEKGVIARLAERFPDLSGRLQAINARVVDLLPVVRNHYYHRDMFGSFSMKAVLPTVAPEMDYSGLDEVQDGGAAQLAYLEAIQPETTEVRREALRAKLLAYCERDTLAMTRPTLKCNQTSSSKPT